MCCFVILLLPNEMQMSVRRFSAIPHLRAAAATKETGKTPPKRWSHDEVFPMNISNKHAAAFRLREKFIALDSQLAVRQGRATTRSADAVSCHAMNSRQLSFSFGRADDSHRELKKTLGQLSFFNSRQLSVSFGPAFRTVVYRIIQSSLNKFAWLTAAFHLNFRNVTQC